MLISNVSYGAIEYGTNAGKLALHVEFGASITISASDLITFIKGKLKKAASKTSIVLFDLRFSKVLDQEQDEVELLFNKLKESKITTMAYLNGNTFIPGQTYFDYIVAFINKPDWLNYKINELVYRPTIGELKDPIIMAVNKNPSVHIFISYDDKKALSKFLKISKYPWGVVGDYTMEIKGSKDENLKSD